MAKTTATVTVGADTRPFDRKMKNLGSGGIGGRAGGLASRAGGAAMSGLGMGLGALGAVAGVGGLQALIDNLRVLSPKLDGFFKGLEVAFQQLLKPAAIALGEALYEQIPRINSAMKDFGESLGDAVRFWTEEAFDPAVWKDIGQAIVESIQDAVGGPDSQAGQAVGAMVAPGTTKSRIEGTIDAITSDVTWDGGLLNSALKFGINNQMWLFYKLTGDEGSKSL